MTQRTRDFLIFTITGLVLGLLCIGICKFADAGEIRITPGDTGTGVYVPYTGATGAVNLGAQTLTTTGTAGTGDHTVSDATPVVQLKDTSCTDSDVNAYLEAVATDTGSGTEDIDVSFYQQVAGAMFRLLLSDADVGMWLYVTGDIESYFAITATEARIAGATPSIDFYDKDGTDADVNASIDINLTATGTGAEDADMVFSAQKAGAMTEIMRYDASDGQVEANVPFLFGAIKAKRTDAGAADYNPSALTTDFFVTANNSAAARAITISTEDVQSGTTANPRIMVVKDEYRSAATYNLTVSLESGTIDGEASATITSNGAAMNLYLDGTNGHIW